MDVMPNFPEFITAEMIEKHAKASEFPDVGRFGIGGQWTIYAHRYNGMTHWRVDVVEGGFWIMGFDAAGGAERYSFNIISPAHPCYRIRPMINDQQCLAYQQRRNAVREHFPYKRLFW